MQHFKHNPSFFLSLRKMCSHTIVTILAIAIAFSLPTLARFILFQWWPRVSANANLMLITEISLAAILVLLFNYANTLMKNHGLISCTKMASLVYARSREGWLTKWRESQLLKKLPVTRDAYVLAITGGDTFAPKDNPFSAILESASEVRVMLINPISKGALTRTNSLQDDRYPSSRMVEEINTSIDYLRKLHKMGKKVSLKFYDQSPFWKLVILGEHVWVQYCEPGWDVITSPEYVFALNTKKPRHGLFTPFYMHFLEKWSEPIHPEYDFETDELIYRDELDGRIERVPFAAYIEQNLPRMTTALPQENRQEKSMAFNEKSLEEA